MSRDKSAKPSNGSRSSPMAGTVSIICACLKERTVLKATNKPTTVKDVVMMAEAKDADMERKRKDKKIDPSV